MTQPRPLLLGSVLALVLGAAAPTALAADGPPKPKCAVAAAPGAAGAPAAGDAAAALGALVLAGAVAARRRRR